MSERLRFSDVAPYQSTCKLTGQGPSCFKLQDGVGTAQELYESVDDTTFNDPVYRRVLLL